MRWWLGLAALAAVGCITAPGKDLLARGLGGFDRTGDANWNFSRGVIAASAGSGPSYLVSKEEFSDFELTVEVFVGDPHNSGIFFRCSDRGKIDATTCYEANIFDKRPDQSGRTGAVPGYFTPPLAQVNAAGKWSEVTIHAMGRHVLIMFDGTRTVDADGPLTAPGPIALQWGAGEVKFRNLRVVGLQRDCGGRESKKGEFHFAACTPR